ncbi:Ser/Thr phosphatase family protein, partial [Necator americanus]
NSGDASGANARLFDYYNTAKLVNQLPTVKEKIDFVNPYERPWTRSEKTWRRAWHPSLMGTRKAWAIPLVPAYFDTVKYYQYLTKTRLVESSLDSYYSGLVPPTTSYEKAVQETLRSLLASARFESEDHRVSAILASLVDEAVLSVAHNVPRLADFRVAYDVQSECFWIRSGFMFLYDVKEIGSDKVVRKVRNISKYLGDDRRKLGELAFVSRDRLAVQLRTREPLAPLYSLESDEACRPIFSEDVDVDDDVLFAPKVGLVMSLWPDENPLWQCPGYFVESEETHSYGTFGAKSLSLLDDRCRQWDAPPEESAEMWEDCAKAQAVASLFTTLCAQAHTHGFTQYTDITRPFNSQLMLSNGIDFVFAVGQLNTLAINIECDGFDNPKTNICHVESPVRLYDAYREGSWIVVIFGCKVSDAAEGMNLDKCSNEFSFSCGSNDLRIFLISDTHLLGERNGHWLDKLRREWQMYRSYRSAVDVLLPDAVFFLGDLMDEGQWGDLNTFNRYADRFDSLFGSSDNKPEVHVLAGNHDLGFHYAINDDDCLRDKDFDHDDPTRNDLYRPTWEALSQESTQLLLRKLEPRAVFNGHTHRGCKKRWARPVDFWEYTVNSFSWRNGDRPTFLLASVSDKHVLVNVCHLPNESTVLLLYSVVAIIVEFDTDLHQGRASSLKPVLPLEIPSSPPFLQFFIAVLAGSQESSDIVLLLKGDVEELNLAEGRAIVRLSSGQTDRRVVCAILFDGSPQ